MFRRFDWYINSSLALLAVMSLLVIYSIANALFWYQFTWFGLAFLFIFLSAQIDWRPLINYRWLIFGIYLIAIILLIATYFLAPDIRGHRSWLFIGPFQIQAAEVAKLSLIILFSYYFAQRHIGIAHLQNIITPFLYLLAPLSLVILQGDLGSALVFLGLWAGYLLVSGIRWRHLIIGFLLVVVVLITGWHGFLKEYQKERIIGFFNPSYDPLGINYNVIQSKIAIGSAGFFGKGFRQGTQSQLGFLPEAHTDFIFAAFVEEWGLVGGLFFLVIYINLLIKITRVGLIATNNFSKLVCLGFSILLLIHFIVNLGSVTGLLPVVGVPLSFFSYGGSNLLTSAILVGIVQSIVIRRTF